MFEVDVPEGITLPDVKDKLQLRRDSAEFSSFCKRLDVSESRRGHSKVPCGGWGGNVLITGTLLFFERASL